MQDSRRPVGEVTGDFVSVAVSVNMAVAVAVAVSKEGGVFVGIAGVAKEGGHGGGLLGTPGVSAEDRTEWCGRWNWSQLIQLRHIMGSTGQRRNEMGVRRKGKEEKRGVKEGGYKGNKRESHLPMETRDSR